MNDRLGKSNFNSLRIILSKHTHKPQKKNTKQVNWITQGVYFNNNYTSKVEIILPDLDETKIVMWNLYVDG